jgi:hypothetical protein
MLVKLATSSILIAPAPTAEAANSVVALYATGAGRPHMAKSVSIVRQVSVFRIDNPSASDGRHAPHSTSYPDHDFIGRSLVNEPSGGVISEARTPRGKGWDAIHSDALSA